MKAYGISKGDRMPKCQVKNCTCSDWGSKYPQFISERKGNKNRARKKSERQSAKFNSSGILLVL